MSRALIRHGKWLSKLGLGMHLLSREVMSTCGTAPWKACRSTTIALTEVLEGLRSLRSGDEVIVITWLDRARRDVLSVHPRGDPSRAQEASSVRALLTAPIPLACTGSRSPPSTADACGCAISKRWTGRRSLTSSQYSAAISANAKQQLGNRLAANTTPQRHQERRHRCQRRATGG